MNKKSNFKKGNMMRRIEIIKQSILQRKLGGPFKHWIYTCFSPTCTFLAKKLIKTHIVDGYNIITFKDYQGKLFFSNSISLHSLYQTIAEQCYEWQWHYYQIPQTKINSNDIVLDCGCAEGIFTFLNRDKAKHIYAFEPLPEYFNGLGKTFSNTDNVTICNHALGAECGIAYLKKAGIASSITTEQTDTKVILDTIDNYCFKKNIKPSYIKADLEGYEMELLKGASETIRKYKPKIAITTYHKKSHSEEITHYLKSQNSSYKILVKGIEAVNGCPLMLHAW